MQLEGDIMNDTLDTGKDSLAGEELETQKKGTTVSDILVSTGKWYILVDSTDGGEIAYEKKELKTSLRANVLAGKHNMNSPAIVFRQKTKYVNNQKGVHVCGPTVDSSRDYIREIQQK